MSQTRIQSFRLLQWPCWLGYLSLSQGLEGAWPRTNWVFNLLQSDIKYNGRGSIRTESITRYVFKYPAKNASFNHGYIKNSLQKRSTVFGLLKMHFNHMKQP